MQKARNIGQHKSNFLDLYNLDKNVCDLNTDNVNTLIDIGAAVVKQFDESKRQLLDVIYMCSYDNGEYTSLPVALFNAHVLFTYLKSPATYNYVILAFVVFI